MLMSQAKDKRPPNLKVNNEAKPNQWLCEPSQDIEPLWKKEK